LGAVAGPSRSVQRGKRYEMAVTDFQHGKRTVAQLVEVGRLGHAWSGGTAGKPYSDSRGPDASRLAWSFVAKQLRN
jgi:poly(3-hydroxybutyrate) depolymerase